MPSALEKQCSNLRCRVRDNATAIISGKIDSVKQPFKPQKVVDENDSTWKDLWQQQKMLVEKIDAFERTKDTKTKNAIIRELRAKYPKIAKDHLEPRDPVQKPVAKPVEKPIAKPIEKLIEKSAQQQVEKTSEKSSAVPRQGTEPPPSYDRACGLTGTPQTNRPLGVPNITSSQQVYPNFRPYPAHNSPPPTHTYTDLPTPAPIIKPEPDIDLTMSPEPEDTRDGDYTEAAATRSGKKRKRSAVTKADLEYQLVELNFKHQLQQITIKKAMAKLDGDEMSEAQLQLEEADVQHAQKKAAVAKKMEELRKDN